MTRNKSIYLLVDTSGSMEGIGMKSLDEVVENVIPRLKSVQSSQPDVKLGIGVIGFGDTAVWITPTSVSVDQWIWQGLESKGFTAMGGALRLLHERLAEEDNNASFLSLRWRANRRVRANTRATALARQLQIGHQNRDSNR